MEVKNYKKFNNKILKILIFLLVFTGILNFLANPYNIFDNSKIPLCSKILKPEAKIQERYTKFIALKLDKRKIDTVFIGSSRTDWALSKNYYHKKTGKNAENLAIGGLLPKEIFDIYDELVKIHPEVKNIYVFIDFAMSLKGKNSNNKDMSFIQGSGARYSIPADKHLNFNELGFAFFSLQSTGNSFFTIFQNLAGAKKRMFLPDGTKLIFYNNDIDRKFKKSFNGHKSTYISAELDKDIIFLLKQFYDKCAKDGKKVYLEIMPSHIFDQYAINTYIQSDYEMWKTALTAVTNVYDFQYPNEYTMEDVKPDMKYFFDTSHATSVLGNTVIDGLIGLNSDFAHKLTPDNVNSYILKDKNKLNNYISNHKNVIKQLEE